MDLAVIDRIIAGILLINIGLFKLRPFVQSVLSGLRVNNDLVISASVYVFPYW